MSRSPKSKVILAHVIIWAGMMVGTAIIEFGSELPRRNFMLFILLLLGAGQSIATLSRCEINFASKSEDA